MTDRVYNFSAGPAALPLPALEEAQRDLLALPGAGASVIEISHRSKTFAAIHERAKTGVKELLGVPDNYHILFIQGGASMQFDMAPMNLLRGTGKTADFIVTGTWGGKAFKAAKKEGAANSAWDGKADNFVRTPLDSELKLSSDPAYVHFTSNETIQGVQFKKEPEVGGATLLCDASSDIMSRPIDVSKYGIIYAGAQKNIGPAGVALVILRDDLLQRVPEGLPAMLDYKTYTENDSLYNTPPTFAIYLIMLVTKWVKETVGGLDKMTALNEAKAKVLYDAIDGSGGYYRGHAAKECRSNMNVAFRLGSEDLEKKFISEATAVGLVELKGHRSVGGCRASIYNAMPMAGVEALRDFMSEFKKNNG